MTSPARLIVRGLTGSAIVWGGMVGIWLLLPFLSTWLSSHRPISHLGPHVVSAILASGLAVPMVVAARGAIDRRGVESLGLSFSKSAVRHFAVGAIAFLLPSALGFSIVFGLGWAGLSLNAPLIEILLFVPALAILVFLLEALPEELAFRGYIQSNLRPALGKWGSVFGQAVLFALWGAALWTVSLGTIAFDRLAMFFFMALVLGMVRQSTGSLWASIGLHVAFQTTAQLLLNADRGHFSIDGTMMMQVIALGVVPFSLAGAIADWFSGNYSTRKTTA